jgi:hypothetical protein
MTSEPPAITGPAMVGEAHCLAQEMARAYKRMVAFYRDEMRLPPLEADAKAREPLSAEYQARLETGAPDQVSWYALSGLAEHDHDAALALWERIQRDAHAELVSGHRAAKALEYWGSPWTRAQFLALRTALMDQWQPANGIERVLIDNLAQAQSMYLEWLELLHQRTSTEATSERSKIEREQRWEPPRLHYAEAIEEAATMVDRWNRLFLRTLRQLRDLRRYTPSVVVGNVNQLNIAQQQMNVAATQQNAE